MHGKRHFMSAVMLFRKLKSMEKHIDLSGLYITIPDYSAVRSIVNGFTTPRSERSFICSAIALSCSIHCMRALRVIALCITESSSNFRSKEVTLAVLQILRL